MKKETLFINDQWIAGEGPDFESLDPGTGKTIWRGRSASEGQVDRAVAVARQAFGTWQKTTFEERLGFVKRFGERVQQNMEALTKTIALETGKPLWESATEVDGMSSKIDISITAYQERTGTREREIHGARSITRHKPHGVIAVFGPYNMPGHLPNGQIVPALLAGNTIVFKPSQFAPVVAELTVRLWHEASLPRGVMSLLQGTRETGVFLSRHKGIDGLFFVGRAQTGKMLHEHFAGQPQKILALEMGGNNPLIVENTADQNAAVYNTILSAYISAGQRCTCARRLYVPKNAQGNAFVEKLAETTRQIRVGLHDDEDQPFMGPVVSESAADILVGAQEKLARKGGTALVKMIKLKPGTGLVSPGLMDVSGIQALPDEEYFGPFLQLIRYHTFDEAVQMANDTRYGLAAGLLCDDPHTYHDFYSRIRAGVISWNRPMTGASSHAPFGGIGMSGNHRPSAYYAADYCAYPVASIEAESLTLPVRRPPGISL